MHITPLLLSLAFAPPSAPTATSGHEHGFNGGTYLTVSAGGNVAATEESPGRAGLHLGTAGGHLWAFPNRRLKVAFGGGLKYRTLHLHASRGPSKEPSWFAVLRVGGGTDRLWGYGLLSPAFGVRHNPPATEGTFNEPEPTLSMELGGGVATVLWRGLFVGAELTLETASDNTGPLRQLGRGPTFVNTRLVTGWSF